MCIQPAYMILYTWVVHLAIASPHIMYLPWPPSDAKKRICISYRHCVCILHALVIKSLAYVSMVQEGEMSLPCRVVPTADIHLIVGWFNSGGQFCYLRLCQLVTSSVTIHFRVWVSLLVNPACTTRCRHTQGRAAVARPPASHHGESIRLASSRLD